MKTTDVNSVKFLSREITTTNLHNTFNLALSFGNNVLRRRLDDDKAFMYILYSRMYIVIELHGVLYIYIFYSSLIIHEIILEVSVILFLASRCFSCRKLLNIK